MKSVALHNLGCKVNSYELDVMGQKLQENGYTIVPFDTKADVYIVNTCSVTNIADRKSRQMLHQAKKRNPAAIVVATGCYVQTGTKQLEEDSYVDLLIGNQKKKDIVEILEKFVAEKAESGSEKADAGSDKTLYGESVTDIGADKEYDEMTLEQSAEHTRAYIKIQDGCNQFCSYCIIPYARGRVRSRQEEDIIREVENLTGNGFQEIVLTGIHISSYGMDFEHKENPGEGQPFDGKKLLHLLKELDKIGGLRRIRLGSLEPRIITEEFVRGLSGVTKLCHHFHLSLQSGCDTTLQRMNRHYTTAQYLTGVELLRAQFVHPAITTDVIVGFPGETQEEFEISRSFLEQIGFYEMHIFPYSMRKGTVAANRSDQVDDAVKKQRSEILLQMAQKQSHAFREESFDHDAEILLEEEKMIGQKRYQTGYSREYIRMAVQTQEDLQGRIITGRPQKFLQKDVLLLDTFESI